MGVVLGGARRLALLDGGWGSVVPRRCCEHRTGGGEARDLRDQGMDLAADGGVSDFISLHELVRQSSGAAAGAAPV